MDHPGESRLAILCKRDRQLSVDQERTSSSLCRFDGEQASDQRIYLRDRLPVAYAGQDGFPQLPFFAQLTDATRYLTASRDHTACQLELDEFQRQFPDVKLSPTDEVRD
jgi:hypothetical protein